MHDHLYEHQNALTDDGLRQYARDLDLDVERYEREAFKEHTYANRVREDFVSGVRSGVKGTPTFFVNGVRYDESWDNDTLLATLEERARPPD